jgi:hypothetical protein
MQLREILGGLGAWLGAACSGTALDPTFLSSARSTAAGGASTIATLAMALALLSVLIVACLSGTVSRLLLRAVKRGARRTITLALAGCLLALAVEWIAPGTASRVLLKWSLLRRHKT